MIFFLVKSRASKSSVIGTLPTSCIDNDGTGTAPTSLLIPQLTLSRKRRPQIDVLTIR